MNREIKNRYDFLLLFDVTDGNPNGDPDAGNLPRIDPETGMGLVTDVCLKRKVRNYVLLKENGKRPYDIFIKEKAVLTRLISEATHQEEIESLKDAEKTESARKWMCNNYYDIRAFGAVMSLKDANAGQVRGPIQLTFARSIDPIFPQEHSITRMAVASEKESQEQKGDNRTMGRKSTVPYGLYLCRGFISPAFANQTGFNEEDLDLFWEALINMFEHDRSASRGMMCARKLIIFKHNTELGNAPAYKLFDLVSINAKNQVNAIRSFEDYEISIKKDSLPESVELIEMI
ncbi:MAG: type I-C CRISPR-associated protein Cas7/Csd2 [Bacteroides graminisolvens]|nr:type I-C CRISPR-associated protein Cas7/Csd2 [Bacteroides graminisolvens]